MGVMVLHVKVGFWRGYVAYTFGGVSFIYKRYAVTISVRLWRETKENWSFHGSNYGEVGVLSQFLF